MTTFVAWFKLLKSNPMKKCTLALCLVMLWSACSHHHDSHVAEGHETSSHHHDPAVEELLEQHPAAILFTSRQAAMTDFATALPVTRPLGQCIPVTAQVQTAQGDQTTIVASANGIVNYLTDGLVEGTSVTKGGKILSITSESLVEGDLAIRLQEARNNYESAKANYERARQLVDSQIISQKEFVEVQNEYENTKLVYDNLRRNISGNGVAVAAPASGYLTQLLVGNGAYVTVGQPLATISSSRKLLLKADVPVRYARFLPVITEANIEDPATHAITSLSALGGRILAYGKSVAPESNSIPVTMEMNHSTNYFPGGFVNVWLMTRGDQNALVVPKTALVEEQGVYFVFLQLSEEYYEKQAVTLGATDGVDVAVLSGLAPDQRLVTRGAILVKMAGENKAANPHAGHVH